MSNVRVVGSGEFREGLKWYLCIWNIFVFGYLRFNGKFGVADYC